MYKTINDINVKGMRVLVRADLNVPVHDGSVSDLTRLERLKPTLDRLIEEGARVIVLSHFGRPKGQKIHLKTKQSEPTFMKVRSKYIKTIPQESR